MSVHFSGLNSYQIRKFLRIEQVRVEVVQSHLNHTKQDRDAKVVFYNQSKIFRKLSKFSNLAPSSALMLESRDRTRNGEIYQNFESSGSGPKNWKIRTKPDQSWIPRMQYSVENMIINAILSPLGLKKALPEEQNQRISNIPYMNGPKPSFNCMVQRVRASSRMGIGFSTSPS